MKRVLLILLVLVAAKVTAQLSVEWNFADFTGKPLRIKKVVIRPLASYGILGTNIVSGDARTFVTGSRGGIIVSNVSPGAYRVRLYGTATITTVTNYFPADLSGLVNASDYVAVSTNVPGEQYAYSAAASDARYMTNAGPAPGAGYVLTVTDTEGGYAWATSYAAASADTVRNNEDGLTLGGTFTGRYNGDAAGLTNVLGMDVATNYAPMVFTNLSQFNLSGFGDPNANGIYSYAGLLNGKIYYTNGVYELISNLFGAGLRWGLTNDGGLYYTSPRVDATGYPSTGTWVVNAGTPPGGRFDFVIVSTNGNGFALVTSRLPVLFSDGNTEARIETYGSDVTGRIGMTPVMPFATLDGVTRYLTNNAGNPTNNGVILLGAGTFSPGTMPILSGQTIVGRGRGVSILNGATYSIRVQNSNRLQNLTLTHPINNTAYGIACTNLTLVDLEVGLPDPTLVIDGIFSPRGYLDGIYGLTAERCHFSSTWDLTEGVATGTFNDCVMDTVGGPANNGSGLHPYTVQWENCFYIIHGGEANAINGPAIASTGGLAANACVWVVATNANVRLFGPRLNHYGTNGVDYAIYNLYGNTNVLGWYWDNGVLMYVNGTNYWTNNPPQDWPPGRLFDHY